MARKYARDNRGRFASVGATARGGRLRTASGGKRATVTMKAQGPGGRISKPRGLKPNPSRPKGGELAPRQAQPTRPPAASRPGSITSTLRGTMQALAKADAARIREIEAMTGGKIRRTAKTERQAKESGATQRVRDVAKTGKVADTLRAGLRELARSDARQIREMDQIRRDLTPKLPGKAKRQNGQLAASSAKKFDLSQAAFEKRANATEKRAKAAEKALSQLDRYSPQNRKALRSAYALRNAADSYASYARRGKTGEFSAEYLFSRRQRSSTAPKLSRSEKAAQTRLANKIKKAEQDRRSFERSRRYR